LKNTKEDWEGKNGGDVQEKKQERWGGTAGTLWNSNKIKRDQETRASEEKLQLRGKVIWLKKDVGVCPRKQVSKKKKRKGGGVAGGRWLKEKKPMRGIRAMESHKIRPIKEEAGQKKGKFVGVKMSNKKRTRESKDKKRQLPSNKERGTKGT